MKISDKKHTSSSTKKIVLIGLPNTGKSQLFNYLTREYALVANYPLTTVKIKKAYTSIESEQYQIVDTPGLHGLYIHSEEELLVRDILFAERPYAIIQCIDTNRLKQSLSLTADLLSLGIPLIISLHSIGAATGKGARVDPAALSRLLTVPVIVSRGVHSRERDAIQRALKHVAESPQQVRYNEAVEQGLADLSSQLPDSIKYKRIVSLLLLMHDPFLMRYIQEHYGNECVAQLQEPLSAIRRRSQGNVNRVIYNKHNQWIDGIFSRVVNPRQDSSGKIANTCAQLSRHPVFGIPIALMVVAITYQLVVHVANGLAGILNDLLWVPVENMINRVVAPGMANDFLIGEYGVLSLGLANALLTILPILSVFFIILNLLEDIGYIPNLCVLTRRVFNKLGLSGNAIMPLVLGFGCKTMATLATKSLRSKKERYIAIYLIAFAIPCAAQMALNMSILGRMGARAFITTFSVLAGVEIVAGIVLNKLLKEDEHNDFIQTLPVITLPNVRSILIKTYYRLYWFVKEAVPVFLWAAVVLFTIDRIGVLDTAKQMLKPVMEGFLGLPLDMVDALILCMARQEAAAGMIMRLVENGQLNYIQCIVAVTITTMFVPCFANIMAMIKELGVSKAMVMLVWINGSSFLIAGCLNWMLTVLI